MCLTLTEMVSKSEMKSQMKKIYNVCIVLCYLECMNYETCDQY